MHAMPCGTAHACSPMLQQRTHTCSDAAGAARYQCASSGSTARQTSLLCLPAHCARSACRGGGGTCISISTSSSSTVVAVAMCGRVPHGRLVNVAQQRVCMLDAPGRMMAASTRGTEGSGTSEPGSSTRSQPPQQHEETPQQHEEKPQQQRQGRVWWVQRAKRHELLREKLQRRRRQQQASAQHPGWPYKARSPEALTAWAMKVTAPALLCHEPACVGCALFSLGRSGRLNKLTSMGA